MKCVQIYIKAGKEKQFTQKEPALQFFIRYSDGIKCNYGGRVKEKHFHSDIVSAAVGGGTGEI
jgi:hypothetical protein